MIKQNILLATRSPRRRELLERIGINYYSAYPDCDETVDLSLPPEEMVKSIALQKALWVKENYNTEGKVILSADTLVHHNGKMLGKPMDEADAFTMLRSLSGSYHEVYTGFALVSDDKIINDYEMTKVKFRELSDRDIYEYVSSGEPLDKAGAYGIQEKGALFVERVNGDYFNVVGLPVCKLAEKLNEMMKVKFI